MPRYDHIFVIVEETKDHDRILDPADAPNIADLAARFDSASRFYGEVHPSKSNSTASAPGATAAEIPTS